jgi:hypothetical protein
MHLKASAEGLTQLITVEASNYFASGDSQWTLNQVRLLRHQLERLLRGQRLPFEVQGLERWTLRINVVAWIRRPEQIFQFGFVERLFGVVPLVQFNRQFVTQETSCVAACSSGGFPEKTCLLHFLPIRQVIRVAHGLAGIGLWFRLYDSFTNLICIMERMLPCSLDARI